MTRPACVYVDSDISGAAACNSAHPFVEHAHPLSRIDGKQCEGRWGYLLLVITVTSTAIIFYGAIAALLQKFT